MASLNDLNAVHKAQSRTIIGKNIARQWSIDFEISPDQYSTVQNPLKLLYLHNHQTKLGGWALKLKLHWE
jgi:hypothetical protein